MSFVVVPSHSWYSEASGIHRASSTGPPQPLLAEPLPPPLGTATLYASSYFVQKGADCTECLAFVHAHV